MYSVEELAKRFKIDDMTGVQRELAEVIGVEATLKLCDGFGRNQLYIPANDRLCSIARAQDIYEGFYGKGLKASELAREYGVTDRTVRQIVNTKLEELRKRWRV